MPEVSVIIPTICRREELQRAIRSVLAQDYSDLELIVVNDSIDPQDQGWLRDNYQHKATLLHTSGKKGANAARNIGIKNSRGEFIAFLDDDDEWLPNKISMQIGFMKKNDSGLCYTGKNIINESTGKKEWYSFEKSNYFKLKKTIFAKNYIGTTSCTLIRKTVFDNIGLFDESLPVLQDYDLFIRIAQKYEISGIDLGLVNYYSDFSRSHISLKPQEYKCAVSILMEKYKNHNSIYLLRIGLLINKLRKTLLKYDVVRNIYGFLKK